MAGKKFREANEANKSLAPVPYLGANLDSNELSIKDEDNPESLISLVPPEFAEFIRLIPNELFLLSEKEYIDKYQPDEIEFRLKLKFWDEWQQSLLQKGTMRLHAIYYGVCTKEFFYHRIVKNPTKLAWIIIPPVDYEVNLRELLHRGLSRLTEIINLPIYTETPIMYKGVRVKDEHGKYMVKKEVSKGVLSEIRMIINILADRVHGAVVQRMQIQQQSLNMNVTAEVKADRLPTASQDMLEQLDSQIKLLEEKLQPFESPDKHEIIIDDITRGKLIKAGIDPASITVDEVDRMQGVQGLHDS